MKTHNCSKHTRCNTLSLSLCLSAGKEAHSLITMTNRARAEAMMAEAVQGANDSTANESGYLFFIFVVYSVDPNPMFGGL